jgi:hypothetical protein
MMILKPTTWEDLMRFMFESKLDCWNGVCIIAYKTSLNIITIASLTNSRTLIIIFNYLQHGSNNKYSTPCYLGSFNFNIIILFFFEDFKNYFSEIKKSVKGNIEIS